tara:strand:+ start:312 stop:1169 length:858 start_codon:yes stop_codon:yes gene_type:complete
MKFLEHRDIIRLTQFLILLTILEKISIFIAPQLVTILPNYMGSFNADMAKFFVGVNSFGASRSNTSVIFLALAVYLRTISQFKLSYWCFAMSILAFSTTGLLILGLLIIFFVIQKFIISILRKKATARGLIAYFILLSCFMYFVYLVFYYFQVGGTDFDRFSFQYVWLIFDYKLVLLLSNIENISVFEFLFGRGSGDMKIVNSFQLTGNQLGDFIYLDMLYRYGVIPSILFIFFCTTITKDKNNRFPIFILLFGSLHYFPAFCIPGQILIATFINLKKPQYRLTN